MEAVAEEMLPGGAVAGGAMSQPSLLRMASAARIDSDVASPVYMDGMCAAS